MGIIKKNLAEFDLSNNSNYRIEYNEGDVIHIHIDSLRIGLSVEEFLEFSEVVAEGYEQLREDKDLE